MDGSEEQKPKQRVGDQSKRIDLERETLFVCVCEGVKTQKEEDRS